MHHVSLRATLATAFVVATVLAWASAATGAPPPYVRTIGGPGHGEIYPSGLDVDSPGNLYVADTGNDQVKKYDASGTLVWSVGTRKLKANSVFNNPRDVAYLNGRVYVADTGYNRVQVLDATSGAYLSQWSFAGAAMGISAGVDDSGDPIILVTIANKHLVALYTPGGSLIAWIGSGPGSANGQLADPRDAATDSAGNIYVADYFNNRMVKFDGAGGFIRTWGTTGTANGRLIRPYGVDVDDQDSVYVADSNNHRLQEFDADGNFIAKWGSKGTGEGQFTHLRRIAVGAGSDPAVYGADLWGLRIEEFLHDGTFVRHFGAVGDPDGGFNEPSGLAVDSTVFVIDSVNQEVDRFDPSGTWQMSWGHRGWSADLSGFNWPRDIASSASSVWVVDTKNSRLTEFTRDGTSTGRSFGGHGSAVGKLNWPNAAVFYGSDLIVANTNSNRIERWNGTTLTPTWTLPGFLYPRDVTVHGSSVYVADTRNRRVVELQGNNGSVVRVFGQANLHEPSGVAVDDATGNIYVSDSNWNRVVQFAADGSFVRAFGYKGSGPYQFNFPTKLQITDGLLYVVDEWNDRVQVFNISGGR
jgi:DNA-binding beta-propeller fold protein YncE